MYVYIYIYIYTYKPDSQTDKAEPASRLSPVLPVLQQLLKEQESAIYTPPVLHRAVSAAKQAGSQAARQLGSQAARQQARQQARQKAARQPCTRARQPGSHAARQPGSRLAGWLLANRPGRKSAASPSGGRLAS